MSQAQLCVRRTDFERNIPTGSQDVSVQVSWLAGTVAVG